jgi:hypothetical protein
MRKITISGGRMVFAPIPYHTFEVGPVTVDLEIPEKSDDEAIAASYEAGRQFIEERMQAEFEDKVVQFFDKLQHVDEYMTSIGMTPRGQQPFGQNSSRPAPQQAYNGGSQVPGASPAQQGLISRRAEAAGVSADDEAQTLFQKPVSALDKSEASKLIDHLGTLSGATREPQERSAARSSSSPSYSYSNTAPNEPVKFPADPVAKTLADMITTKQLGMIRAVAKDAHLDADEECRDVMSCQVTELSRRAASALIDHLRQLAAKNAGEGSPYQRRPESEFPTHTGPVGEDPTPRMSDIEPQGLAKSEVLQEAKKKPAPVDDSDIPF